MTGNIFYVVTPILPFKELVAILFYNLYFTQKADQAADLSKSNYVPVTNCQSSSHPEIFPNTTVVLFVKEPLYTHLRSLLKRNHHLLNLCNLAVSRQLFISLMAYVFRNIRYCFSVEA